MGRVDRTFARTEEREVKRLKREEYLRSKEEHWKRENDELASEEEITNMTAEDESNLEPLCAPESTKLWSAPIVTSELSAALDRVFSFLIQNKLCYVKMSATVLQEVLDTKSVA